MEAGAPWEARGRGAGGGHCRGCLGCGSPWVRDLRAGPVSGPAAPFRECLCGLCGLDGGLCGLGGGAGGAGATLTVEAGTEELWVRIPGRGWTLTVELWTWVARVVDVADLDGCGRPLEP